MKDWQKGYELDYLKGMESRWDRYNSYSKSPFTEQRKDKIAKGGTKNRCPDIKKIKKLGFKQKVFLEQGLKKTINYY